MADIRIVPALGAINVTGSADFRGDSASTVLYVSGSGNVGVGTSNPISKFHVAGAVKATATTGHVLGTSTDTGRALSILNSGLAHGESYSVALGYANSSNNQAEITYYLAATGSVNNRLGLGLYNSPDTLNITGNGRVGIGTTAPGAPLHIVAAGTSQIRLQHSAYNYWDITSAYNNTNADLYFIMNGSEKFRIDANGNVGIGTTSPGYKLDVSGTGRFLGSGTTTATIFNNSATSGTSEYYAEFTSGATALARMFRGNGAANVVANGLNIDNYAGFQIRVNQLGGSGGTINLLGGNVGVGTTDAFSRLTISVPATNTISFDDQLSTAGITVAGSDALVRLQLGVGNSLVGPFGGWIQASYDNTGPATGSEPLLLNPVGGYVGVGTTSPSTPFHSVGQVRFSSYGAGSITGTAAKTLAVDSSGNVIEINNTSLDGSGTANYVTKWSDSDSLTNSVIYDNGTNVGIGTTSPVLPLQVSGRAQFGDTGTMASFTSAPVSIRTTTTESITLTHTAVQSYSMGVTSGGTFALRDIDAQVDRINITQGGNVGIGVTNPNYLLETKHMGIASSNAYFGTGTVRIGGNADAGSNQVLSIAPGVVGIDAPGVVNGRFIVNGSGNVGIGTASPGYTLDVNGTIAVPSFIRLTNGGPTVTYLSEAYGINLNGDATHPVQVANASLLVGLSGAGSNYGTGNLYVGGNSFLSGDLSVTGKITAREFHTTFVSASIIYQSGSTQFGNSGDDTHAFIGRVTVSGSTASAPSGQLNVYAGDQSWSEGVVVNPNTGGTGAIFFRATKDTSTSTWFVGHNGSEGFSIIKESLTGSTGYRADLVQQLRNTGQAVFGFGVTAPSFTGSLQGNITGTAASETLATVTGRGASTTSVPSFNAVYTTGNGDFTNTDFPSYKINPASGYWRIVHLSQEATISGVYNYQSGKNVYWGEPGDAGQYLFRGRTLIVSEGNVGIGTTTPTQKLDVSGYARATSGFVGSTNLKLFGDNTSTEYLAVNTNGTIQITAYGAGFLKTDAAGDVSVDTNTYLTAEADTLATVTGRGASTSTASTFSGGLTTNLLSFTAPTGDPSPLITSRVVPAGQGAASEVTELILFHSNDPYNSAGPDYITLRSPAIRLQTYNDATVDDIDDDLGSNDRIRIEPNGTIKLSSLTSNGFVKTSAGDGTLSVDTNTYLTAEADTLATVTARGASTATDVAFGANSGGDLGIQIRYGSGAGDYGRIRFYQNSSNHSTIHSFSAAWNSGTVFTSAGAINITGQNGVTFGAWNDIDAAIVTGGVSYFKGSVGIGSTSPGAKLDVTGNVRTSTYYNFNGNPSVPTSTTAAIFDQAGVGPTISGLNITFRTDSSTPAEIMRVSSGGNVGIGTTSPGAKLDVTGDINIDGSYFYKVANNSVVTAPADHGLVAYYGFDEGSGTNISDKTGRNNTTSTGLTYTTTSIRGTALDSFGGDSNYVTVPNSSDFDFGTGDFAISIWCRPNSSYTNSLETLIEIGRYTAGILIRPESSNIQVYSQGALITDPYYPLSANNWYHIVVSRISSTLAVYANGTRLSSVSNSSDIQVSQTGFIGRSAHATGQVFHGIIDEVKIYKGKGLNYGEVRGQYLSRGTSDLIAPIFSNTNGSVGIGTTSPGAKLDVTGTGLFGNTASGWYVSPSQLHIGGTGTAQLSLEDVGVSTAAIALDGDNFAFGHQNSSPTYTFKYSSTYNGNYATTGTTFVQFNPTTNYINSGNVGIGLTAPEAKLDVNGASILARGAVTIDPDAIANSVIAGGINDTGWGVASGIAGRGSGAGDTWAIGHNSSNLYFGIGDGASANTLSTWMEVSPSRVITLPSYATAGFLKTNASGVVSVDTSTYLTSYTETDTLATVTGRGSVTSTAMRVEAAATGLGGYISVGNSTEVAGNYSAYFFGNTASDANYFKGGIAYETIASTYGRGNIHFLQNTTTSNGIATLSDSVMTILNGGNVGIGTTSPAEKLAVAGNIRSAGNVIASVGLGYGNYISMRHDDNNGYITITRTVYDGHLVLEPYANVGIGNTSPSTAKLVVTSAGAAFSSTVTRGGNMNGIAVVATTNADTMTGIWFATGEDQNGTHWSGIAGARSDSATNWATHLAFYTHVNATSNITQTTEKMRITGEGSVGIGTTSPASLLDVAGTWKLGDVSGGSFKSYTYGTQLDISGLTSGGWARAHKISTSDSGGHVFFGVLGDTTTLTRAYWTIGDPATIDTTGYASSNGIILLKNGNVGIGNTSPSGKLHVTAGGGDGSAILRITGTASDSFNWASSTIYANLTAGETVIHQIGKAESQYNSGHYGYRHVSDNSSSNMMTIGMFQADYLVNILGNGNVGIGVTNPTQALHVAANVTTNTGVTVQNLNGSYSSQYRFLNSSGTEVAAITYIGGTTSSVYHYTSAAGNLLNLVGANVGIGTTSPGAKLDVVGDIFLSETGRLQGRAYPYDTTVGSGADAATAIIEAGSTSGYRSRIALAGGNATDPNTIKMLTTSAERVRITSAGRVGIGTSNPGGLLGLGTQATVQSTSGITLGVNDSSLEFVHATFSNGFGSKIYSADSGGGVTSLRIAGRGNSTSWSDLVTVLVTDNSTTRGNVGIATTSPGEKLDVVGNIALSGIFKGTSTGENKNFASYDWHWLGRRYANYVSDVRLKLYEYFYSTTAAVQEAFVNCYDMSSVNYMGENIWGDVHSYHAIFTTHIYVKRQFSVSSVLLNGDDPYALWVDGAYVAGADGCCSGTTYSYTFTQGWHRLDLIYSEGGGGHFVQLGWNPKDYTDYIAAMTPFGPVNLFDTGDVTMRNDRVGIGTTNPGYRLEVDGTAAFGTTVRTEIGNAASDPTGAGISYGMFHNSGVGLGLASGASSTNQGISFWNHNGSTFFRSMIIAGTNGNVGIGSTVPAYKLDVTGTIRATGDVIAYSDRRVKENIVTLENSLDLVTKLRGVEYNKIGEEDKKIGVIAQEVLEVLPQVVQQDNDGNYSVAYGNMAGLFIEAIKQQQTHIQTLEDRITVLEQLLRQKL